MKSSRIIAVCVLLQALAVVAPARSQVFEVEGLSPFEQVAMADLIVVGAVTAIESQPVLAERARGTGKTNHLVGTIRIEEHLLGAKGLTHVRVGFVPELAGPARDPAVPVFT